MNTNLTINERITDLRMQAGLSQKELCALLSIPASSLSRIERGEITNVSNDILVKLANYFRVSTDYLLGMTKVTSPKNVELDELGLSNKALLSLLSGNVDGALLSRLIEHPRFALLLDAAAAYFRDDHKEGLQSRNDIINLATASIKDFAKEHPEKKREITGDVRRLNLEKISGEEADLNKLRNLFLSMLKDIKADYHNTPEDISRAELKEQLTEIKTKSDKVQLTRKISEAEMADIVTSVLTGSGMTDLDETETKMFHELFRHILERMGKGKTKMDDVRKQIEEISDKEDFLEFLNNLIKDWREKPDEWENVTVKDYLEAMVSWIEDFSTSKHNDIAWENFDYVTMAKILYMGKIYE